MRTYKNNLSEFNAILKKVLTQVQIFRNFKNGYNLLMTLSILAINKHFNLRVDHFMFFYGDPMTNQQEI